MKGPAQPSPMIGQCLSGGLGWLEVECNRCRTRASLLLDPSAGRGDKPRWGADLVERVARRRRCGWSSWPRRAAIINGCIRMKSV